MINKVSDSIKNRKKLTWWIIGTVLVLCTGLLTIGAFYDYQITDALYTPNFFSRTFTLIGHLPAMLAGVAFAASAFFYINRSKRKTLTVFTVILWFIECGIASYFLWDTAKKEVFLGMGDTLFYILLGISIPLFFIASFFIFRCAKTKQTRAKLFYIFLIVFFVELAANLILIEGVRLLWGRPRYYTIDSINVLFTPWYLPQGYQGGNMSFPSGHAGSATMALTALLFLTQFQFKKWQKALVVALPIVLIICTCFARMMQGMHFLADVTIGFLLGASMIVACTFLVDKCFFNKINRSLTSPDDFKQEAIVKK